jgi:hypothetical protein
MLVGFFSNRVACGRGVLASTSNGVTGCGHQGNCEEAGERDDFQADDLIQDNSPLFGTSSGRHTT